MCFSHVKNVRKLSALCETFVKSCPFARGARARQAARGAARASRLAPSRTGERGSAPIWHSQHSLCNFSSTSTSVHLISLLSFHFDCWTSPEVSDQGGCENTIEYVAKHFKHARHATCRRNLPRLNRMHKKDLHKTRGFWKSKSHENNTNSVAFTGKGERRWVPQEADDLWRSVTIFDHFKWRFGGGRVSRCFKTRGLRSGVWTHHWRGLTTDLWTQKLVCPTCSTCPIVCYFVITTEAQGNTSHPGSPGTVGNIWELWFEMIEPESKGQLHNSTLKASFFHSLCAQLEMDNSCCVVRLVDGFSFLNFDAEKLRKSRSASDTKVLLWEWCAVCMARCVGLFFVHFLHFASVSGPKQTKTKTWQLRCAAEVRLPLWRSWWPTRHLVVKPRREHQRRIQQIPTTCQRPVGPVGPVWLKAALWNDEKTQLLVDHAARSLGAWRLHRSLQS